MATNTRTEVNPLAQKYFCDVHDLWTLTGEDCLFCQGLEAMPVAPRPLQTASR